MSSPVYGVRSRPLGQTSYYQGPFELKAGDYVLVAAEQGSALGRVVSGPAELPEGRSDEDLPQILRQASPEDICQGEENDRLAAEATAFCRRCIRERRMDMKLVDVEVFFDRSKLIFYFTAPARIDFRDLVKDLVREYRARIELRQIGVRHETQMVGGRGQLRHGLLLPPLPAQVRPCDYPYGQGTKPFSEPRKNFRDLRSPALLPGL